jgi:hypothetical protein
MVFLVTEGCSHVMRTVCELSGTNVCGPELIHLRTYKAGGEHSCFKVMNQSDDTLDVSWMRKDGTVSGSFHEAEEVNFDQVNVLSIVFVLEVVPL